MGKALFYRGQNHLKYFFSLLNVQYDRFGQFHFVFGVDKHFRIDKTFRDLQTFQDLTLSEIEAS